MSRVGVFGGTFDPPHIGHLAIAHAALEELPLDRLLFVPARRSPLKERAPVASDADRLAMLEAAIGGEPRFGVSRVELERDGPSYTVETLERLRDQGGAMIRVASRFVGLLLVAARLASATTFVVPPGPGTPPTSPGMPVRARCLPESARAPGS